MFIMLLCKIWKPSSQATSLSEKLSVNVSCCRFGAVFLWDSGSSVGEVSGHAKLINSVDIRQKRPYRLATASDDTCGSFFEGPPFKFKFTLRVCIFFFF